MNFKPLFILFGGLALLNTVHAQNKPEPTFKQTAKGALYHIFAGSDTAKIKVSDVITFHVVQKTGKDSVLFSSYTNGSPVKIQVQPSQNIGDLMDIFPLMGAKDSAIVKIPADSIFKGMEDRRPPFLPKQSFLTFTVKMVQVQTLNEAIAERNAAIAKMKDAESASVTKYIADNKLKVLTTASGLKYDITLPTLKRKPVNGDTLVVNYTGRTLDGRVFDSSVAEEAKKAGIDQPGRPYEPFQFVVGQGSVIKGWDEGLLLLSEGSKATLVIPSAIAYGEQGNQGIPPYAPLAFDIELVKIKPAKHIAKKLPAKKGTGTAAKKAVKKATPVKKSK